MTPERFQYHLYHWCSWKLPLVALAICLLEKSVWAVYHAVCLQEARFETEYLEKSLHPFMYLGFSVLLATVTAAVCVGIAFVWQAIEVVSRDIKERAERSER